MPAREAMAYAQFLAGMAFNNARWATSTPWLTSSAAYDLPHGVCNAVLLPHVESHNASSPERLRDVATAMGAETRGLDAAQGAGSRTRGNPYLSQAIGIPGGLAELGAKADDIPTLAANAMNDACGSDQPRRATQEEIEAIFHSAL